MTAVQEFTAKMYGANHCQSVNDARIRIFMKKYGAKEDNEQFLKKLKNFDSNFIPPCWISLLQKILRTIYVNSMWLNATDPTCAKLNPESYGWHFDGFLKATALSEIKLPGKSRILLKWKKKRKNLINPTIPRVSLSSDESDIE